MTEFIEEKEDIEKKGFKENEIIETKKDIEESPREKSPGLVSKTLGKPFKISFSNIKRFIIVCIIAIPLILAMPFFLSKAMSNFIEQLNPFNMQQKAVAAANRTEDAFSTIQGTQVDMIPMNGIEKMFNWTSKTKEEVIISVPKLWNESPIFDDDNERNIACLKRAWINSINVDRLENETKNFQVLYNTNIILQLNDGVLQEYDKLSKSEINKLTNEIKDIVYKEKDLNFTGWEENKPGKFDVEYRLYGEFLKIDGLGVFKQGLFSKKKNNRIRIVFERIDNEWVYLKSTLKVGE